MERTDAEIKKYIKEVVDETKRTANVDTGFLKRSIRGNWFNGIATFREIFYGAYNDNAKLIQNANRIMPKDIPWRVIFVDEEGRQTVVEGETRTGRKISRKSVTSGNVSTSKIKALIQSIRNGREKKKDSAGKGSGKDND